MVNREGSDRVLLLACSSGYQEADAVTSFLKTVTRHRQQETSAVLYRAHYQSRAIEEALIKRSNPYTIIGGIQFYDRKEIKDLLAYLRLIANPLIARHSFASSIVLSEDWVKHLKNFFMIVGMQNRL